MNLLFMANNGLPKNGLVALYDPYRDTYGRNILPVGSVNFVTRWNPLTGSLVTVTPTQETINGEEVTAYRIQTTGGTSKSKLYCNISGLPNPHNTVSSVWVKVLSGKFAITSTTNFGTLISSNVWQRISISETSEIGTTTAIGLSVETPAANLDILVYQPQVNLSTLYPYSPPAGLPQSATDYTGHANNAVLGSTSGADTNDPKYNGVALVGDGVDDYAVVPLASAAYRISVVDSGSGYVVVDEVPAYLNLFKTGADTYLNGKIGPTAYYNRVPTAAEIAQAKRYFKRLMSGRGVTVS